MKYRTEKDLIGEKQIPANSYMDIQSLRGLENVPITGIPISYFPDFIRALAYTKKAAEQPF
jgi:aspartate ammonia-lyase